MHEQYPRAAFDLQTVVMGNAVPYRLARPTVKPR